MKGFKEKTAVLTFDIESDWGGRAESVTAADAVLPRLMETIEGAGVPATFFVNASILGACGGRLRALIGGKDHEISSHGLRHVEYGPLGPAVFKKELLDSKKILEDFFSSTVKGYRAPRFSVTDRHFDILGECGFSYDSSFCLNILSLKRFIRTFPGFNSRPHYRGGVLEVPVSHMKGIFLPAGLLWINLAGLRAFKLLLPGSPLVLYAHMFDFHADPQEYRVSAAKKIWYRAGRRGLYGTFSRTIAYLQACGFIFRRMDSFLP